jgi:hypothetical protein
VKPRKPKSKAPAGNAVRIAELRAQVDNLADAIMGAALRVSQALQRTGRIAAALLRAVGSNASLYGSGGPQDGNFDSLLVGVPGIQRRLGQRMWVGAHIETVDQGQNRHYRSIRQQAAKSRPTAT